MIDDVSNRLLMSDSIRGMIPDLEEEKISDLNDSFVIAVIEVIYTDSNEVDVFAGKVEGISFESQGDIKLDVGLELKKAYDVIKKHKTTGLSCRMLHVCHGDDEFCIEGRYKISSAKLFDFDIDKKICTLGIDLIKLDHN